jgi:predicted AAA+ superfamily ATPase
MARVQVYIPRHAESVVQELSRMFGVVLVSGTRQVGKSTLLEHLLCDLPVLSMDDAAVLRTASESPELFFEYNKPPVLIGEIQKAPDIFPRMKLIIDRSKGKGLFYLSGSEQLSMMKNISESLAGRIGIVNLMGLSLRERFKNEFRMPFIPSRDYLDARATTYRQVEPSLVWRHIHRGDKPELEANPDFDWAKYYGAYVRTYLERDVRKLVQVSDELKFQTFMAVVAAHTGRIVNLAGIAHDVGISQPTAQRWLSILVATNIVFLLRPFYNNHINRAVKTPKLYFADTGLAAYLTSWNTPEVLRDGAMAGAFFETFVVGEVMKGYQNEGILDPPLYYYRDKDKREIDLLIIQDGVLCPLEIKKTAAPKPNDLAAFKVLDRMPGYRRGSGGVLCLAERLMPLTSSDVAIPLGYL